MHAAIFYTLLGGAVSVYAQLPTTTFATVQSARPEPVSQPPPLATGALRIEECFTGELSNQRFSRDAAASIISDVCDDLIKHSVVFGPNDNRHLPSGAPFDGDSRKQGAQVANASAILYVHPDFMAGACPGPVTSTGQAALLTTNFGKVSKQDCMAPFLMALDGCGDFTNANGVFWKWGGSVNKDCITYTVDANVDTKFAPGPGY